MSTHINAYYGDVEDKKEALVKAKSELDIAERALKDHPDYEAPKKVEKTEEPKEDSKVEVKKK